MHRSQTLRSLLVLLLLLPACTPQAMTASASQDGPIDTGAVRRFELTGNASRLTLTTDATRPYSAEILGRNSGWLPRWLSNWRSNWSDEDCKANATLTLTGETLTVAVAEPFLGFTNCEIQIRANLPAEASVTVRHDAILAALDGRFSAVSLEARAADVTLGGEAGRLDLKANALRAAIDFTTSKRDETVTIGAKALDASLRFAGGVPLHYTVDAKAAIVDSTLPDTPGAGSSVAITGDYVRATIR